MEKYVIIIAVVHAYLFAVMFFAQKKLSSRFLGFYMLNFFIQSFLFANFHIFKLDQLNPLFYLLISSLSLCDWPIMFLYVKKMSEESYKLRLKSFVHFIPALILLILQFVFYLALSPQDRQYLTMPKELIADIPSISVFLSVYSISVILLFVQIIGYSISMIIKLVKHRKNIAKQYSYTDKITLNWLFAFVVLYLLYFAFEIVIFAFPSWEISETTYFSIVSVHIFIVGIWGLRQRDIYAKSITKAFLPSEILIAKPPHEDKSEQILPTMSVVDTNISDKKQALLSDSQKTELAQKITVIIEGQKLYLNPEMSLDDLANVMMIHKNYVSYVINDVFKMNFYNYINRYRIEEAKKMLLDKSYDNLSIEGIAKSCGYKSRNVFYPVFKKLEGITPLEYKKKNQG